MMTRIPSEEKDVERLVKMPLDERAKAAA